MLTQAQMLQAVLDLAQINSGSYNPEGVWAVARYCQQLAAQWLQLPGEYLELGPHQEIANNGAMVVQQLGPLWRLGKRLDAPMTVLCVGHLDTVFAVDHPFQQSEAIAAGCWRGPGLADMKGGVVVLLAALAAFEASPGAKNLGWEVVLTPDEEIGSPLSKAFLQARARQHQVGLLYEPALDSIGTLAGARKGSGDYVLVATGRAAHAGRDFDKGRHAIWAMSELVRALHLLNGQREGLTINVGNITGGEAVNVVPAHCLARVNIRFWEPGHAVWFEQQLDDIMQQVSCKTEVALKSFGGIGKQPKRIEGKTSLLYNIVHEVALDLGQDLTWRAVGGCCDGNNLAEVGLPNVDTLGVCGGNIHSDQEYMVVDSLVTRAKLTTALLHRLSDAREVFPKINPN
jgi:glutamate carboxypeptidase